MSGESITLGIFNHLFITTTLAIVSFAIVIVVFWLVKREYLPKAYQTLAGSFIGFGLHWGFMTAHLMLASQNALELSKILYITSFSTFTCGIAGIIFFSLSLLYENQTTVQKAFISIILGILPGVTIFFTDTVHNGITVWDSTWILSTVTLYSFGIGSILLAAMGLLMVFIHAFDKQYTEKHLERLIMKFGSILLILYLFIGFLDYYLLMNGWGVLWLRLGALSFIFILLLFLLHKRLRTYGFKVDLKLRSPLMLKSVFFSLFTTVAPVLIAAYLLTISFRTIIVSIVGEDFIQKSVLLEQQIFMTSVVLGFFSFFISLLIVKILENKMKRIIQGMYEVLNNNFAYRIKNVRPIDELGSLGLSFNDMAQDLQGYAAEIDKYSDLLEAKVGERTTELKQKSVEAQKLIEEINENTDRLSYQTDNITNQMQDALLVLDIDNKIQRYNSAFLSILQIEEKDYHGVSFLDLDIIKEYEDFKIMLEKFSADNLDSYQQKITLKPPLSGMLESRLTRFSLGINQSGIIMLLRDISLPWGVVYDSQSKEPVASVVVRLYNEANNKIIAEEITDDVGRFMFYVNPGNYYVRFFKDGYNFPSQTGIGYHGEVITITDKKDSVIHFDVLIDKIG